MNICLDRGYMFVRKAKEENGAGRKAEIARVAENLFSKSGYDGVSIRDIANKAGVNSALVGYHFGTKEQLYRTLFERRYHEITALRVAALESAKPGKNTEATLRLIVRAWAGPLLDMLADPAHRDFVTLLTREAQDAASDPRRIFRDFLDPAASICIEALQRALPNASQDNVVQGYLWMVACMSSFSASAQRGQRLGQGEKLVPDVFLSKLEVFLTHGLLELASHKGEPG